MLALAGALLLAACASAPPPAASGQAALAKSAPISLATTGAQPAVMAPELRKLSGLNETEVKGLLGEPDFRRREPPAEIWQYRNADCVLDIFLYSDAGHYRVAYAETHDRSFGRVSQSSCYATLTSARPQLHQSQL